MRLTIRILWHALATVSLVVWVAVGYGWISSEWHTSGRARTRYSLANSELRQYAWCSEKGRLGISIWRMQLRWGPLDRIESAAGEEKIHFKDGRGATYRIGWVEQKQMWNIQPGHWWERNVVYFKSLYDPLPDMTQRNHQVVVSYWVLFLISGFWLAVWVMFRWRKKRKLAAGICLNCGYDLRASPEQCPECGAAAVVGEGVSA